MTIPTALMCHVYAGGHTIGTRAAGFEVNVHLEEWPFGADTSRLNLDVEVRVGMENWNAREFQGKISWLASNPPCAAFSVAGVKVRNKAANLAGRWRTDPRCAHTLRCFDLIDDVEPAVFTWECVAQAEKAHEFQAERVKFCHDRGYDVHALLFNVKDCGIASQRRRFFFVASRLEFDAVRPSGRQSTPREAWAGLDPGPIVPCGRNEALVLATMAPGRGELANHYTKSVTGMSRQQWAETGHHDQLKGRPSFMHKRLGWDEPAFTVAGGQHLYHPDEPRALTVAEQAALLGYPRGYVFAGPARGAYAQIGKAVTPPAAKWLGEQVMRAVLGGVAVRGRAPMAVKWDFLKTGGDGEPVEWDLS